MQPVDELLRPISDIRMDPADHLLTVSDGPALRGAQCQDCATLGFPMRDVCMNCGGRRISEAALPREGSLYSYATVHVSASRPTPYTIGYVDLTNGVRLLSAIRASAAELAPDLPVRLALEGDQWFFTPAGGSKND